jgi:hypothetical protein
MQAVCRQWPFGLGAQWLEHQERQGFVEVIVPVDQKQSAHPDCHAPDGSCCWRLGANRNSASGRCGVLPMLRSFVLIGFSWVLLWPGSARQGAAFPSI